MLFDVQRRQREGWTVLAVIGELDLAAVPRLRNVGRDAVPPAGRAGDRPRVVVDLTSVDFLDSAGLGVVLGVVRRARAAGGEAVLAVDPQSSSARVLAVLGLDRVVPVVSSVDEAVDPTRSSALLAGEGVATDG